MDLYTTTVQKWRKFENSDIEFLDTTVKSGVKLFAPSWDIVMGVKDGSISEDEYTRQFYTMMRKSFQENQDEWLSYLKKPKLALACYCPAQTFCHRHLLVDIFEKVGNHFNIKINYLGEK